MRFDFSVKTESHGTQSLAKLRVRSMWCSSLAPLILLPAWQIVAFEGSATRTAEPDQSDRSSVKLNIAPDRSQFPQRGQSTLMISLYALNLSVVACFELESDLLLDVEVMQHVESLKYKSTVTKELWRADEVRLVKAWRSHGGDVYSVLKA